MATHAPRRRLSRLLDQSPQLFQALENVPQMIPLDLYERHLTPCFTVRSDIRLAFAALCSPAQIPPFRRGRAREKVSVYRRN